MGRVGSVKVTILGANQHRVAVWQKAEAGDVAAAIGGLVLGLAEKVVGQGLHRVQSNGAKEGKEHEDSHDICEDSVLGL